MRDLADVPEIVFAKPESVKRLALPTPMTAEEKRKAAEERVDAEEKAMERTAHVIAKINHVNKGGRDRFLEALRQRRRDLDGLPFVMGDACRQDKQQALAFVRAVDCVQEARKKPDCKTMIQTPESMARARADHFWTIYSVLAADDKAKTDRPEPTPAARITALMQMLAPEDTAMRQGLVAYLATRKDAEATRALTGLAVYTFDADVRKAALVALKTRDSAPATELLRIALRYPWPAVVAHAGDAIAQLGRKDLVPQLVALLDEPDPRAPAARETAGKRTLMVREVVRLNHHRNCLLCHPPGNTPDVLSNRGFPSGEVVTGGVPSPGVDLPPPSVGYGFGSPDILVRADVTYLRQDFSRMQPVKDAAPWPAVQRFDFLVRTRVVTDKDAATYQAWLKQQGPDYLPPHRQAALTALRALTGRDAAPTAQAWGAVLAK